jgi:hypothetical protein
VWYLIAIYNWAVIGIVLSGVSSFAVKDPGKETIHITNPPNTFNAP